MLFLNQDSFMITMIILVVILVIAGIIVLIATIAIKSEAKDIQKFVKENP